MNKVYLTLVFYVVSFVWTGFQPPYRCPTPPPPPTPSPFLVKIQRIEQMLFFVLVWKTFTGDGDSSTLAVRGLWNSDVIAENISGINIGWCYFCIIIHKEVMIAWLCTPTNTANPAYGPAQRWRCWQCFCCHWQSIRLFQHGLLPFAR